MGLLGLPRHGELLSSPSWWRQSLEENARIEGYCLIAVGANLAKRQRALRTLVVRVVDASRWLGTNFDLARFSVVHTWLQRRAVVRSCRYRPIHRQLVGAS